MPLTASCDRLLSSVFMKDGAKVLDVGVPLREPFLLCLGVLPGATSVAPKGPLDCIVGVDAPGVGAGDGEKRDDFGRPALFALPGPGDGDAEPLRANGLPRRFVEPLELNAMVSFPTHHGSDGIGVGVDVAKRAEMKVDGGPRPPQVNKMELMRIN